MGLPLSAARPRSSTRSRCERTWPPRGCGNHGTGSERVVRYLLTPTGLELLSNYLDGHKAGRRIASLLRTRPSSDHARQTLAHADSDGSISVVVLSLLTGIA